ncbi:hypothetical protein HK102_012999, partial [Quaeritorhiza haematococci]
SWKRRSRRSFTAGISPPSTTPWRKPPGCSFAPTSSLRLPSSPLSRTIRPWVPSAPWRKMPNCLTRSSPTPTGGGERTRGGNSTF